MPACLPFIHKSGIPSSSNKGRAIDPATTKDDNQLSTTNIFLKNNFFRRAMLLARKVRLRAAVEVFDFNCDFNCEG